MDGMGTLNLVVSWGVSCSLGVICKEKCISRSIRFFPTSSCTTGFRGGTVQISELNLTAVWAQPFTKIHPNVDPKNLRSFKSMDASPASSDDWGISVYIRIACICQFCQYEPIRLDILYIYDILQSAYIMLQYLYLQLKVQNHWFLTTTHCLQGDLDPTCEMFRPHDWRWSCYIVNLYQVPAIPSFLSCTTSDL